MKKEVWGFEEDVITFLDDELIGGHEQFLKWAMGNHGYKDFRLYIGGLQPISRDTDNNAAMYNCWWTSKRS